MASRKKRGRRSNQSESSASSTSGIEQLPWNQVQNPYPPFDILSPEQIAAVDRAAMRILRETGLRFQNEEALNILQSHGADVDFDTGLVKFDSEVVKKHISHAPELFTLHARNPQKNVLIGKNYINFSPVSGPPNISDLENGRRPGTYQDQCNLIKLTHFA